MNENQLTVDSISLINVANEFVSLQSSRQRVFGKFTEKDLTCWKDISSERNKIVTIIVTNISNGFLKIDKNRPVLANLGC